MATFHWTKSSSKLGGFCGWLILFWQLFTQVDIVRLSALVHYGSPSALWFFKCVFQSYAIEPVLIQILFSLSFPFRVSGFPSRLLSFPFWASHYASSKERLFRLGSHTPTRWVLKWNRMLIDLILMSYLSHMKMPIPTFELCFWFDLVLILCSFFCVHKIWKQPLERSAKMGNLHL